MEKRPNRAEHRKPLQQASRIAHMERPPKDEHQASNPAPVRAPQSQESQSAPELNNANNLWIDVFGWHGILRWDVLGTIVPGIFIAVGLALLSVDWFPHNLLISQVCFGLAGSLVIIKIVGHVAQHRSSTALAKIGFIAAITAVTLIILVPTLAFIQKHKSKGPNLTDGPRLSIAHLVFNDPADDIPTPFVNVVFDNVGSRDSVGILTRASVHVARHGPLSDQTISSMQHNNSLFSAKGLEGLATDMRQMRPNAENFFSVPDGVRDPNAPTIEIGVQDARERKGVLYLFLTIVYKDAMRTDMVRVTEHCSYYFGKLSSERLCGDRFFEISPKDLASGSF